MDNIKLENVAKEILNSMKEYTQDVEKAIGREVARVGDEATEQLQDIIYPSATDSGTALPSKRRTWESYANSWENSVVNGVNFVSSRIHNKKHYSLVHLLEYGHVTRDGKTRTRAFAHVKPVSEKYSAELEKNVIEIIKNGGNKLW